MKHSYLILLLIIMITCDRIDEDIANQCNPAFIFKEDFKNTVDYTMIADQVFQPYCSPCHSTSSYILNNSETRIGYLPLDDQIKNRLSGNLQFYALFEKYIDFDNPSESLIVKSIKAANVKRADFGDNIDYREPRFNCFLPDDYVEGLIWWIENANGKTENLFK